MDSNSDWATETRELWNFLVVALHSQELSAKVAASAIAATAAGILALMVGILLFHLRSTIAFRRAERLRAEWISILLDSDPDPSSLVVGRRDAEAFMKVWAHLLESVRGEYRDALVVFVRKTGVPAVLRTLLAHGTYRRRLEAIATLGSLQDEDSRQTMATLALGKDPYISLAAALALVRIHPREAIEMLLPHMVDRHDWPLPHLHAALLEGDPAIVSSEIVGYVMSKTPDVPLRAIKLMALVRQESRSMLIRTLLTFTEEMDWEAESALLEEIQDPLLVDLVRERLEHPRWQVIVSALKAIARIGSQEDLPVVAPLLGHSQWWVRYRAARAIANLPDIKPIEIELMAARHPDPYARDMLRFALSEQSLS